jgi:hypothetical protein
MAWTRLGVIAVPARLYGLFDGREESVVEAPAPPQGGGQRKRSKRAEAFDNYVEALEEQRAKEQEREERIEQEVLPKVEPDDPQEVQRRKRRQLRQEEARVKREREAVERKAQAKARLQSLREQLRALKREAGEPEFSDDEELLMLLLM